MTTRKMVWLSAIHLSSVLLPMSICVFSAAAHVIACQYDALSRLTQIDYGDGNVIEYTYDAAGNRLTKVVTGACLVDNPTAVAASDQYCSHVRVSWSWGLSGQDGFIVYRDDVAVFSGSDPAQRWWDDTTGDPGTVYEYRVVAKGPCGEGPSSSMDGGVRVDAITLVSTVVPSGAQPLIPRSSMFTIDFDQDVDPATVEASGIACFGNLLGLRSISVQALTGTQVGVSVMPALLPGEVVSLTVLNSLTSVLGCAVDPFSVDYMAESDAALAAFQSTEIGAVTKNSAVAAGDFDEDGDVDLLCFGATNRVASVYTNDGSGVFTQGEVFSPTAVGVVHAVPLDYDRDGHMDCAVASWSDHGIQLLTGDGAGSFTLSSVVEVPGGVANPHIIVAGDLDGDGWPELMTANWNPGDVAVFSNVAGTYLYSQTLAVGTGARDIDVTDMNGDGLRDLVVAGHDGGRVEVYLNTGQVTQPSDVPVHGFAGPLVTKVVEPQSLVVLDRNADGFRDVAVSRRIASGTVRFLLNDGSGQLSLTDSLDTGPEPDYLTTADLDGDGKLDLLFGQYFAGGIEFFLAEDDEHRSFAPSEPTDTEMRNIVVADFDGDGVVDLATTYRALESGRMYVWFNQRVATGIAGSDTPPTEWTLYQNVPNPFNPVTQIRFYAPRVSSVNLRVYDASGRLVRVLLDGTVPDSWHSVEWNGLNDRGQDVASGVYFYRLIAGDFVATKKMVLIK